MEYRVERTNTSGRKREVRDVEAETPGAAAEVLLGAGERLCEFSFPECGTYLGEPEGEMWEVFGGGKDPESGDPYSDRITVWARTALSEIPEA